MPLQYDFLQQPAQLRLPPKIATPRLICSAKYLLRFVIEIPRHEVFELLLQEPLDRAPLYGLLLLLRQGSVNAPEPSFEYRGIFLVMNLADRKSLEL